MKVKIKKTLIFNHDELVTILGALELSDAKEIIKLLFTPDTIMFDTPQPKEGKQIGEEREKRRKLAQAIRDNL